MPDKNKTSQPASGLLEEEAYQRIKHAIIDGSFSPADKLSIRGVCATLSLSPMPVRAALRRLINERALDATTSGTALVPRLTRQEFQELTQMRLQLEPLALRLAAPHLTGSDYTKLNALVASHEAARLAGNPAGVRQADTDFMLALYRASRSQLLLSFRFSGKPAGLYSVPAPAVLPIGTAKSFKRCKAAILMPHRLF
jgi:DNA-binding GntR family transcriptional regulator